MRTRKLLLLSSCAFLLSGVGPCVTVPNVKTCSAKGLLAAGANCAESQTGLTTEKTLDEYVEFLEAQPERPDPADPTRTLPARAGAMCQSAIDYARGLTALEQACKLLGWRCSREIKEQIQAMRFAMMLVAQ